MLHISRSMDLGNICISSLSSIDKLPFPSILIFSPFRVNNNVVLFPLPFHVFMPLANLWLIRLQGQFPIPRTRVCSGLYPFIRPPKALGT